MVSDFPVKIPDIKNYIKIDRQLSTFYVKQCTYWRELHTKIIFFHSSLYVSICYVWVSLSS